MCVRALNSIPLNSGLNNLTRGAKLFFFSCMHGKIIIIILSSKDIHICSVDYVGWSAPHDTIVPLV